MTRNWILNNFRWKAISLALSVAVWCVIEFGATSPRSYLFDLSVPILVINDPAQKTSWQLTPATTRVWLRVPLGTELAKEDVVAFVNLTAASVTKEIGALTIQVDVPAGMQIVKVEPASVIVRASSLP